ncbi:hypothetical protein ACI78V_13120 [Geodermatophilus sp. SYSU D00742]
MAKRTFGTVDEITPAAARSRQAEAGRTTGPMALAQTYRLLRSSQRRSR